jgi:hypothetical protein
MADEATSVRFQVLAMVSIYITVFWDAALCSLVDTDRLQVLTASSIKMRVLWNIAPCSFV